MPTLAELLGDEYSGNEALANFEDVPGLAKGFLDLKEYQGQSVRIPSSEASAEDRTKFFEKVPFAMPVPGSEDADALATIFKRLGHPDSVDDYEVPTVEGTQVNAEPIKRFIGAAHKAGLTKAQVSKILTDFIVGEQESVQASQAAATEQQTGLKLEWGETFEEKSNLALLTAVATGAPTSLITTVKEGHASPDVMKWLVDLNKRLGKEGTRMTNQDGHPSGGMTPAEAERKKNDILNNKDHAYWNANMPGHDEAVKSVRKLYQAIDAGKAA